jgi:hypothetical protein
MVDRQSYQTMLRTKLGRLLRTWHYDHRMRSPGMRAPGARRRPAWYRSAR